MKTERKAYQSPHNSNVYIIPSNEGTQKAEFDRDARRTAVYSELSELKQRLVLVCAQLEENNRTSSIIKERQGQLVAEIAQIKQRVRELEEEKKRL